MSEHREGYAGGVLWALLSVGAGILIPQPPAADADAATILAYFSDNHSRSPRNGLVNSAESSEGDTSANEASEVRSCIYAASY